MRGFLPEKSRNAFSPARVHLAHRRRELLRTPGTDRRTGCTGTACAPTRPRRPPACTRSRAAASVTPGPPQLHVHPAEVDRRPRRRLVPADLRGTAAPPPPRRSASRPPPTSAPPPRRASGTSPTVPCAIPTDRRDLPLGQPELVLQPQNFSNLPHRMALRHATSRAPQGRREAPFRHDHPCVPAPTGAPRGQPATRPPSWPPHRPPRRRPVNPDAPPYAARVPPEPLAGSPEPLPGCRRNGWPGHRNRCPGAVGTAGRVTSERVAEIAPEYATARGRGSAAPRTSGPA